MRIRGSLTNPLSTLAALAALAACADTPTAGPGEPALATAASDTTAPPPDTISYDGEQHYEDIARQVKGYAGHWYDEAGDLVVLLTDRAQASAAVQAIAAQGEPELAEGERRSGVTRILDARYDFATLRDWRNASTFPVLAVPGVVGVDLDEERNRVAVWIADEGPRASVEAELRNAGVPAEAAIIEVTGAAEAYQLLTAAFPTMRSGIQIQSGPGAVCTLGHPGLTAGPSYVTASHCTQVFWWLTPTPFFQPLAPAPLLGTEAVDPPGWPCWPGLLCRWSDAALIPSGLPSANQIAATTGWAWHWAPGSLNTTAVPPLPIVNPPLWVPRLKQVMDKIGRSTGWNRGFVTNTCVNMLAPPPAPPGRVVLCQYLVTNMSRPGDSGAPTFRQLPFWRAQVAGTLWGALPGPRRSIVSTRRGVRIDLGA